MAVPVLLAAFLLAAPGLTAQDAFLPPQAAAAGLEAHDSDSDGTPDARDPNPLVFDAPALTWRITSLDFGWETEAVNDILEKNEDSRVKEAMKSLDFSRRAGVKLYGEAEASMGYQVQAQGTASLNIFKNLGSGVTARYDAGASAKLGVSASGELDWRRQNQERARELNTVMKAVDQRVTASRPFLDFTVLFVNTGDRRYDCEKLEIPVMSGFQVVAYAQCRENVAKTDFDIPPNRPQGVPVRFRAALDNSEALGLLELLEKEGPTIRIENSRGRIVDSNTVVDVISLMQTASQNTCALTVRLADAPPVTWRVARRGPEGAVTLVVAMEAVNALVRNATDDETPLFKVTAGVLDSIAGVDNGGGRRWWRASADGQEVAMDLAQRLGGQVSLVLGEEPPPVSPGYMDAVQRSAEAGMSLHQYFLGVFHATGTGVPKDEVEAAKWHRKAAEQGNAWGQCSLGDCYRGGSGVPKDETEATKWYGKAAEQGPPYTQWNAKTVDLGGGTRLELVWCPPGTFTMGSPTSEQDAMVAAGLNRKWAAGETSHQVTLTKGFWLGRYEVTQRQWQALIESNPSHFQNAGPDAPVESVSWNDCQVFLRKLNARVGGGGFRLPTEAEWEYACRAGTETALYTGDIRVLGECNAPALDPIAWYGGNSGVEYEGAFDSSGWPEKQENHTKAGTHPVGRKKANAWGLHDMIGNVWEWCWDWRGEYLKEPVADPQGPDTGRLRVNRGGGWTRLSGGCRAAAREGDSPAESLFNVGFRVALAAPVR